MDLSSLFQKKDLKIIKLIGYSNMNKENDQRKKYHAAKRPFMKGWQDVSKPGLAEHEAASWLAHGGWTGLVIPKGYLVVDIDDRTEGELLLRALKAIQLRFHAIRTVRGFQFFFRDDNSVKAQDSSVLMACGVLGDYRLAEKGQVVLPSRNTEGREWIHIAEEPLSHMPIYFQRLKKCSDKDRPFPVPMLEGGRNNAMYAHACRLIEFGYTADEINDITSFTNRFLFHPSIEQREYIATLRSALKKEPSGTKYGQVALAEKKQRKHFKLTEVGNAERLVDRQGDNLRYCIEYEEWLIWNGSTWEKDQKKYVERIALKTFREMYKEAADVEEDSRRQDLAKWAKSSERSSTFLNSIARAEAMIPVTQSELNANKMLLNCKNGVVDLQKGKLIEHDRRYLMTLNTNIQFDDKAACPTWINFLHSIFKSQKIIDFLQKAVGYSLTGNINEQCVFFLWGNGRNGKSTFINVVKQLTGGEPITARFLRKEFFEFMPEFKIFFTTNHKPIIKGDDEGIWRRIKLIPFDVTIPIEKVDKRLPEKLESEMPGILNWAIEGAQKWLKEGLQDPDEVKAATAGYREEMDLLSDFLEECCVMSPDAKIQLSELYKQYTIFCEDNGDRPLTKQKFSRKLESKGIEKRKYTGNKTFFFKIGLVSDSNSYKVTEVTKNPNTLHRELLERLHRK